MMDWYARDTSWLDWLPMTVIMLALWGALVVTGVPIYRGVRRDPADRRSDRSDARRLLDERFARGEIDAEEYARSLHLLQSESVPSP